MASLLRYMRPDRILVDMKARNKAAAIRELALPLKGGPEIGDFREFLSKLFQEESRGGTGVGEGVAIPHYRDGVVDEPVIGLGLSQSGIDWGDGKPVQIVALIGWPDKHSQTYLKTVAEVARVLHSESARQELLKAETPEAVVEVLKKEGVT